MNNIYHLALAALMHLQTSGVSCLMLDGSHAGVLDHTPLCGRGAAMLRASQE